MKVAADGRADRQMDRSYHYDPYSVTVQKPNADRNYGQATHGAPVQLKAEVALRMQKGDNREGSSAASKRADVSQQSSRTDNKLGRKDAPAPIPLKSQITMRMHNGDNREGGVEHKIGAANNAARDRSGAATAEKKDGLKTPMSREDKLALCKQTGVCIPMLQSSDDSDDKTM
ncbi:MAG TPA: hypothetical protein VFF06_27285 [Polyangia bacterium]|nr:hypothetical protein [Polyangia bacterium]